MLLVYKFTVEIAICIVGFRTQGSNLYVHIKYSFPEKANNENAWRRPFYYIRIERAQQTKTAR